MAVPRRTANAKANSKHFEIKLYQEFEVDENNVLGCGAYGQVYKATRKSDGRPFAIKIVKVTNGDDAKAIKREVDSLAILNHPNIVRYFNSWIEKAELPAKEYEKVFLSTDKLNDELKDFSSKGYMHKFDDPYASNKHLNGIDESEDSLIVFQDSPREKHRNKRQYSISSSYNSSIEMKKRKQDIYYLFIQMELCIRTLRNDIDNYRFSNRDQLNKFFRQICEGLSHIHEHDLVHRDLKPENIFISENDCIKIGDFGLSRSISNEEVIVSDSEAAYLTHDCGTLLYMAPEIRRGQFYSSYTQKVDIYSLGIILLEMLNDPMTYSERIRIAEKILTKNRNLNEYIPKEYKPLLRQILNLDESKRPTPKEILKDLNPAQYSREELQTLVRQASSKSQKVKINKHLKQVNLTTNDQINLFLDMACKVFQLHGGVNITMPSFLDQSRCTESIPVVRKNGEVHYLSHNSRIMFAKYIMINNISSLRRYSRDRVFTELSTLKEIQECSFDIIAPKNDAFYEAEILFIAQKIFKKLNFNEELDISYFINHKSIFEGIIEKYPELAKNKKKFVEILTDASKNLSPNELETKLSTLKFLEEKQIKELILSYTPIPIMSYLKQKFIYLSPSYWVQEEFKKICDCLKLFKMDLSKVYVVPLLLTPTLSYSGMFCQIVAKSIMKNGPFVNIASGGRYDEHIKDKACAVGISFNVENIVQLTDNKADTKLDQCVVVSGTYKKAVEVLNILWENDINSYYATSVELDKPILIVKVRDDEPLADVYLNGSEDVLFVENYRHSNFILYIKYLCMYKSL